MRYMPLADVSIVMETWKREKLVVYCERRIAMRRIYACLLMLSWVVVPVFASAHAANGIPYSEGSWKVGNPFILKVQDWEKERGGPGIFSYGSEMFREFRDRSSERDRQSDSAISGTGMRSYDTPLGPSFDMPDSVNGHSRTPDPWWGRRPEGDPMIRELSRGPLER